MPRRWRASWTCWRERPYHLLKCVCCLLAGPEPLAEWGTLFPPHVQAIEPRAQAIDPLCRVSSSARTGTPRRALDVDQRRGRMSGACSSRPRTRMRRARARIANVPPTTVTSTALGADAHTEDGRHHDIAGVVAPPPAPMADWARGKGKQVQMYQARRYKRTSPPLGPGSSLRMCRYIACGRL